MEYKEISRRGLIRLNGDFDQANDEALKKFLEGKGKDAYEGVHPYEQVLDKMETNIEKLKGAGTEVSAAMGKRVESLMDKIVGGVLEEVDRMQEVIDEHKDDQAYPDSEAE